MGRQIRKSKGKTMKPNFFVFCEGESEVAYISHLRSQYRAPKYKFLPLLFNLRKAIKLPLKDVL